MPEIQKRGRGRPVGFDREAVLQEATKLFWENGYEGTTFEKLTAGMGISPSTFYNSFGSKEELYRIVAESAVEETKKWLSETFGDATFDTRVAFVSLLERFAYEFTREDFPHGCMVSLAGTHQSASLSSLRQTLAIYRADLERACAERISKGVADGDLPLQTDVDGLAAYFHTVIRGLAVQARDGASRERLSEIGRIAMYSWPKPSAFADGFLGADQDETRSLHPSE
jgi:AcrR family transcriptional regulator